MQRNYAIGTLPIICQWRCYCCCCCCFRFRWSSGGCDLYVSIVLSRFMDWNVTSLSHFFFPGEAYIHKLLFVLSNSTYCYDKMFLLVGPVQDIVSNIDGLLLCNHNSSRHWDWDCSIIFLQPRQCEGSGCGRHVRLGLRWHSYLYGPGWLDRCRFP